MNDFNSSELTQFFPSATEEITDYASARKWLSKCVYALESYEEMETALERVDAKIWDARGKFLGFLWIAHDLLQARMRELNPDAYYAQRRPKKQPFGFQW